MPVDAGQSAADDARMELTAAIVAAFLLSGMTQEAVEEASGIDQARLSRLLRGKGAWPTLGNLRQLERAFRLPEGYLLGSAGLATTAGVRAGQKARQIHRDSAPS